MCIEAELFIKFCEGLGISVNVYEMFTSLAHHIT